jgi:phosphoribosylaminoimidazole-succinocarboxamide synthase
MYRLVVLVSGNGTNLQAIIDACVSKMLPNAVVTHVFSNRQGVKALQRAHEANIPSTCFEWDRKKEAREDYDKRLAAVVMKQQPTLIVLAGWMHLLSPAFLRHFDENQIINLHPALPGTFPGAHAIQDAYGAQGLTHSGVMVHTVVEEMDAGETILQLAVPRFPGDTLEMFEDRIHQAEKVVLVNAIGLQLIKFAPKSRFKVPTRIKSGKVRDIYDLGCGMLLMEATDRCSCFDQYVCDIPQKGNIINRLSAWWLAQTRHIIPNHMVHSFHDSDYAAMVVKRCQVFPIEFVVRGYITGSTNTAMWTLYSAGVRLFNNVEVSDGLSKNEELNEPIVTPTTKSDEHDQPISGTEIIECGIMTQSQYDYCHSIAIRLFKFGQTVAAQRGLILVDTKYEFGYDPTTEQIILVDELHTCDSSRYWKLDTYSLCFETGVEPERFDKDMIRLYIKECCDPYAEGAVMPAIPEELIQQVGDVYMNFYAHLTGQELEQLPPNFPLNNDMALSALQNAYFSNIHRPHVVLMYNDHDYAVRLGTFLKFNYGIYSTLQKQHPYRGVSELLDYLSEQSERKPVIYVVVDKKKSTRKAAVAIINSHTNAIVLEAGDKKLGDVADRIQRVCRQQQ